MLRAVLKDITTGELAERINGWRWWCKWEAVRGRGRDGWGEGVFREEWWRGVVVRRGRSRSAREYGESFVQRELVDGMFRRRCREGGGEKARDCDADRGPVGRDEVRVWRDEKWAEGEDEVEVERGIERDPNVRGRGGVWGEEGAVEGRRLAEESWRLRLEDEELEKRIVGSSRLH
jgi:hypothetical protein